MPDVDINGIVVSFPVQPYPVQMEYMAKVIECLQNSKHGVLESPTGTGKTLSLLCSSLSWLLAKKAQLQAQATLGAIEKVNFGGAFFKQLNNGLEKAVGVPDQSPQFGWALPKIVYASRTHSQLSQAMQELKKTSYKHVTAAVLGSRDQLCIHPEVSKEPNTSNKIHMCHAKVRARTCFYYNNVETRKDDPVFKEEILDIEDLVKAGQKLKCCPYFLSRELKQNADITFMPYNYLLDPKTRKSQGIDLQNNVVLLDEAHNVEKTCEEAASLQISSTDVAMCIDEVTAVMQAISDEINDPNDFLSEANGPGQRDFTAEDLIILKTMFLELEKAIDAIPIKKRDEGETLPGGYIFELLQKADLTYGKEQLVMDKLEKIVLYLTTTSNSPYARKGNALQKFHDLLRVVFSPGQRHKERIKQCYKVYIQAEEQKRFDKKDGWNIKKSVTKEEGKLVSYWCFSPGFGMQQLIEQGVRTVILTSGTLSPLAPFISEISIPIDVQLENPHIINGQQICVGVLSQGPDGHPLNSSFNTRNDPKYIASLGRTVYNFSCLIPDGLLIFFPSYPIMRKCRDEWQTMGLWTKISERKSIYVEPQTKHDFPNIMNEYYKKIKDPASKGAIFMAVCRGKVSEGLDFANANGRAVLITGLPFPPLKDPKVVLKQRYLEEIRTSNKEGLSGQQWYQLEASRAVNQAIGRIIRHKNDYGAIILCDCRFQNSNFKKDLSAWIRPHIKNFSNFGLVTRELRDFFRHTESILPQPRLKSISSNSENCTDSFITAGSSKSVSALRGQDSNSSTTAKPAKAQESFNINMYMEKTAQEKFDNNFKSGDMTELLSTDVKPMINFNASRPKKNYSTCALTEDITLPPSKKRKLKMLPVEFGTSISQPSTSSECKSSKSEEPGDKKEVGKIYLKDVKRSLSEENYKKFAQMIQNYTKSGNFDELLTNLDNLFPLNSELRHLFLGFKSFLKKQHIISFNQHIQEATL